MILKKTFSFKTIYEKVPIFCERVLLTTLLPKTLYNDRGSDSSVIVEDLRVTNIPLLGHI